MTPTQTQIPDMERIASDHLRADPEVAAYVDRRVVASTPRSQAQAWVRVQQLNATGDFNSQADHLINYLIDFHCYAGVDGGQPEAVGLAKAVRSALHAMPGQTDEAVVTAVRFAGMTRSPDASLEPARQCIILTASIWAHA